MKESAPSTDEAVPHEIAFGAVSELGEGAQRGHGRGHWPATSLSFAHPMF